MNEMEIRVLNILKRRGPLSLWSLRSLTKRQEELVEAVNQLLADDVLEYVRGKNGALLHRIVDPELVIPEYEADLSQKYSPFVKSGQVCRHCGLEKKVNKKGLCSACNVHDSGLDPEMQARVDKVVANAQPGPAARPRVTRNVAGRRL